MKSFLSSLFGFIISTYFFPLLACDCADQGLFHRSASYAYVHSVAEVKIVGHKEDYFIAELQTHYRGIKKPFYKIIQGEGITCNEILSEFVIGQSYFVSLMTWRNTSFSITFCGECYLKIDKNRVISPYHRQYWENVYAELFPNTEKAYQNEGGIRFYELKGHARGGTQTQSVAFYRDYLKQKLQYVPTPIEFSK